jgi:PAB1-binding protein PBP1
MKARGRSFERARDEANAVEDLFNRDDKLFGITSQFGKDAYYGKHSNGIAKVLKALLQARADRLAKNPTVADKGKRV